MWKKLPQHLNADDQMNFVGNKKIAASYRRCRETGIDPALERIRTINADAVFPNTHAQYMKLISITRRCFEDVHLTMSDRSAIFILTDSDARIIEMFSLPEILYRCSRVGLVHGASLKEESCGTNAVALTLHHGEPVVTKGEHHFCNIFKDWSFMAAPVLGTTCETIACIAIAFRHESGINEKYPLVRLMAEKIENNICDHGQTEQTSAEFSVCRHINATTTSDEDVSLSHCQNLILSLLKEGHGYKEIAAKLNISYHTVKTHMERLRLKFGVKKTTEMIAKYGSKVIDISNVQGR